jgi:hypothetical protein
MTSLWAAVRLLSTESAHSLERLVGLPNTDMEFEVRFGMPVLPMLTFAFGTAIASTTVLLDLSAEAKELSGMNEFALAATANVTEAYTRSSMTSSIMR